MTDVIIENLRARERCRLPVSQPTCVWPVISCCFPTPRWQQYQQVAEVEVVLASNRPASDLKRTVRTPGTEVVAGDCFRRRHTAMTDLLLKSTGPFADQYKLLAGDQVVGHIRLSEAAPTATPWRRTLAYWQQCPSSNALRQMAV